MPLDIISGKQNTSKYVHSTLVISDKRETAEADKGQRAACGGSASGHCHPPAARGTAPAGTARLACPPGPQSRGAPAHFPGTLTSLHSGHQAIQTAEKCENAENLKLKITIITPLPNITTLIHILAHFSGLILRAFYDGYRALHTNYKMSNHDFPCNI